MEPESRDMTAFMTPLGLLRIASMPTGFTNSPAEFQKCMVFILHDEILHVANIFIDDLPIKGPKNSYVDANGQQECLQEILEYGALFGNTHKMFIELCTKLNALVAPFLAQKLK
jgi:hypothetical protein